MRTWRLLGQYDAETVTYSTFAVAGMASPFTPDFNGMMVGLRAIPNRSSAASLLNHVSFKLTCANWRPNVLEVGCQGTGLQTAPAGENAGMDWNVQQPIIAGVPITLEGRNLTADTPVTVSALLYGCFDVP